MSQVVEKKGRKKPREIATRSKIVYTMVTGHGVPQLEHWVVGRPWFLYQLLGKWHQTWTGTRRLLDTPYRQPVQWNFDTPEGGVYVVTSPEGCVTKREYSESQRHRESMVWATDGKACQIRWELSLISSHKETSQWWVYPVMVTYSKIMFFKKPHFVQVYTHHASVRTKGQIFKHIEPPNNVDRHFRKSQ